LKTVTLSTSITEIPVGLFEFCGELQTVKGVGELTSIGDNAFYDCGIVGLNSDTVIELGNKIESIGNESFYRCKNIKAFNANSSNYVSKDDVLYQITTSGLELALYPSQKSDKIFVVEDAVAIQKNAFVYVENLQAIKIDGNVKTIENDAFFMNSSLETVLIGNSVKKIISYAFDCNYALKQVMIGTDENLDLESIGGCAFRACKKLEVIVYSSWAADFESGVYVGYRWYETSVSSFELVDCENALYDMYKRQILSVFNS
jgi:hypothetical protein